MVFFRGFLERLGGNQNRPSGNTDSTWPIYFTNTKTQDTLKYTKL